MTEEIEEKNALWSISRKITSFSRTIDGQNPSTYSIILTLNKMLVLKKIQIDTFSVDKA